MNSFGRTLATLASLLLLGAAPLAAQGQFGRAVAIHDAEVIVVKTGNGRGPAAAYVYSRQTGEWVETARLGLDATGTSGQGLSPSISAGSDGVFIGSGDPAPGSRALVYRREASDAWVPGTHVVEGAAEVEADRAFDLQGLRAILGPPQRIVTAAADMLIVATLRQGGALVETIRRDADSGAWTVAGELVPASGETDDGYGSAILATEGRIFVGAPRQDDGVVYVFEPADEGWRETGRIEGSVLGDVGRFGTALAVDGGVLYAGAPGTGSDAGTVVALSQDRSGKWGELRRIVAPGGQGSDQFGASIASGGGHLWVGAPALNERAGRVFGFVWVASGDLVAVAEPLVEGAAPGDGLGSSVAASPSLVVAGAPRANGGVGYVLAALQERDSDDWNIETLEPSGALSTIVDGEVRCVDGDAAGFSCGAVDLLSFLTIDALGGDVGERVSDIWGWTDPETGREYALVGRTAGLVIVDITEPAAPRAIGMVPANHSGARDIKVYADHAFFTGDGAGDHGLVVFDLTRLRSIDETPATFEPDARYEGIQSAHNLAIDTESGFAFAVGASGGGETCGGGLHMVDVRTPKEPAFAGCYTDTEGLIWAGRTHDTQCVVYRGPDADYEGRQLCFASNETALRIVDVTDKQNPAPIAAASYPSQAYIHQGWLTEDHRYFYLDDELDELIGNTNRTRTLLWDLADLDDPTYAGDLLGPDNSTDHNLYIKGNRMYQANYQAGLRVVDISDPTSPSEVGYFDTTPYGTNPSGFDGAWTAFPFFESGTVIVSSMNEGLFILRPERPLVP